MAIISAPVIASPDTSTLFHIEADSLDFTVGAVLSQMSTDNDNGIQLHISANHFPRWNETTRDMTRRC